MSYCRIGENSDVYIFRSGTRIECIFDARKANDDDIPNSYTAPSTRYGKQAMLGYLQCLQFLGYRVPEYAITRLCNEIAEAIDGDLSHEEKYRCIHD